MSALRGEESVGYERAHNGWTGGQYSALRVAYALAALLYVIQEWLGGQEGSVAERWLAVAMIALVALPLALGWLDRLAAVALSGLLLAHRFLIPTPESMVAWPAFESLLILHAFVPGAPYGALRAGARRDPAGEWVLPDRLHDAAWLVVGLSHLLSGLATMSSVSVLSDLDWSSWLVVLAHLLVLPLALWRHTRVLALTLGLCTLCVALPDASLLLALVAHVACFTPSWLPPDEGALETVYYDGSCGLCHHAVRFCLAEDSAGALWRYAPLQGTHFEKRVSAEVRATLPDSIVIVTAQEEVLTQSAAVIHCLSRFGGGWRLMAWLGRVIPRPVADLCYASVARARHRLFKRPEGACPLVPVSLRQRFLLD